MVSVESHGRQRSAVRVHRRPRSRAAGRTAGARRTIAGRHSAVAVPPEGLSGGGGDPGAGSAGKNEMQCMFGVNFTY